MATVQSISINNLCKLALNTLLLVCLTPLSAEELAVTDYAIVNTGQHVYMRNCAVCHGREANGDGPYTPMLVTPPPSLTTLSKSNGGHFPFERAMEIISGNELLPAHGARDMPIWGQVFAAEAATLGVEARSLARSRILELMAYLEHIQQK